MKKIILGLFVLNFIFAATARSQEAENPSVVGQAINYGNDIINNTRENLKSSAQDMSEEHKKTAEEIQADREKELEFREHEEQRAKEVQKQIEDMQNYPIYYEDYK